MPSLPRKHFLSYKTGLAENMQRVNNALLKTLEGSILFPLSPMFLLLILFLVNQSETGFGDPDSRVQPIDLENKVAALLSVRERVFEFFSLKFG